MRKTCLECISALAGTDKRVVFIGSDLGPGVLEEMKNVHPERWFMEGVSEQHIVGMAAGLAMDGFIPYVNTIATFITRRCLEQVIVDVAMHQLPVRLIGNGGGVVYGPLGPTHMAVDDIALLRPIPNMTIVSPCDANEISQIMSQTVNWPGPIYIRLARGGDPLISATNADITLGKAIVFKEPGEVLLVSTGIMTQRALEASAILESNKILAGVLHFHTIKPFDDKTLLAYLAKTKLIVTIEEHSRIGGLGSAVIEAIHNDLNFHIPRVIRLGLPDKFIEEYGRQDDVLNHLDLTVGKIVSCVNNNL